MECDSDITQCASSGADMEQTGEVKTSSPWKEEEARWLISLWGDGAIQANPCKYMMSHSDSDPV